MTPEQKEEINRTLKVLHNRENYTMPAFLSAVSNYQDNAEAWLTEAIAALEESQQQRDYWANKEEEARWESAKWCEDLVRVNKKLAEAQLLINEYRIAVGNCYSVISRRRKEAFEAQQTIARQREALEFYANGKHIELNAVNQMVSAESGYKARAALGKTQP